MDGELKIAIIGLVGALIGGILSFYGTYYALNQQQEILNEQQVLEQQNMALALYIDVSDIERRLNISMHRFLSNMHNDTDLLDNPNYIIWSSDRYYYSNWIYAAFGEDISGFDPATAVKIYDFYKNVAEIEDYSQFIYQTSASYERGENISLFDLSLAHLYTKGLYEMKIPECIQEAEEIKKNLREKYDVDITLSSRNFTNKNNQKQMIYYGDINNTKSMALTYY